MGSPDNLVSTRRLLGFKRRVQTAMQAAEPGIQLADNVEVDEIFWLTVERRESLVEAKEAKALCWCRSRWIIAMRRGKRES